MKNKEADLKINRRVPEEMKNLANENKNSKSKLGASLVTQWLRICLPMQGTRV